MYKISKKIKETFFVPCKRCIFYINDEYYGKCGKFLNIYKEYYNSKIAKKKFCDNNPKYIK